MCVLKLHLPFCFLTSYSNLVNCVVKGLNLLDATWCVNRDEFSGGES